MSAAIARRRAAILLAAAVAALAAAPVAADAAVVSRATGSAAATARYWTADRLARARPLELVRGGSGPALRRVSQPPPFESFAVPDPTALPLSAHGKLFGSLRGFGRFQCSATVVNSLARSVVMTAGHCVYEPRSGIAAKRLVFVPAYAAGARPFGRWTASVARTTPEWAKRGNYDFDYATLTLRPNGGARIEDLVGGRVVAANTPREQVYNAYGYPANFANAQRLWSCRGAYAGDDPDPVPGGPPPIGMACDMKEGASGGGWVDDLGRLVSVSSFGYPRRQGFLYGPYLTPRAARLVARSG